MTLYSILNLVLLGVLNLMNNITVASTIVTIEQKEFTAVLKTPAKPVTFPLSAEQKQLIQTMKTKLTDLGGVGLAAPQINQGLQIVAIFIPESAALLRDNVTPYPMHILINPTYEIIKTSALVEDFEACYSVSSKAGKVTRAKKIRLTYFDENGQQHESKEEGFYARVIQHEIDHLQGVLITDRLGPDSIQGSLEEMMALRRQELAPEKRALYDALMAKKLRPKA